MNLGQLINRLRQEDPNRQVPIGFCNPHSHRGDYSELAFEIAVDLEVRALLSAAEYAINRDFEGYKGGSYRMTLETDCYLVEDNSRSGIEIDDSLLDRILVQTGSVTTFKPIKTLKQRLFDTPVYPACYTCGDSGRGKPTLEYPDGEDCPDCDELVMTHNRLNQEKEDRERSGYILAMRLLQSDLELDDAEMGAIAYFTKPEVMRRVLRTMK